MLLINKHPIYIYIYNTVYVYLHFPFKNKKKNHETLKGEIRKGEISVIH